MPVEIRDDLWSCVGSARQEVSKTPSPEYVKAARVAIEWARANPDPPVPEARPEPEAPASPQGSFNFGD